MNVLEITTRADAEEWVRQLNCAVARDEAASLAAHAAKCAKGYNTDGDAWPNDAYPLITLGNYMEAARLGRLAAMLDRLA